MTRLLALLLAGGSGTRFWPLSRQARPKQLLAIGTDRPLLAATSERLAGLIPPSRQLVMTSAATVDAVAALLPDVPRAQIIGEPVGRDTAPCIGLAAAIAERIDPQSVVVALPSDHVIGPAADFLEHLRAAEEALAARPDAVLVFGIEPDHPATGYGYLRRGAPVGRFRGREVFALDAFVEKPDRARAEAMLAQGGHLWNAGLFAFRPAALGALYRRHLPAMAEGLQRLAAAWGRADFAAQLATAFPTLQKVSIDYGVMERATGTLMLPLPLRWDDVGTFSALPRLLPADAAGNVSSGPALLLGARRCITASAGGLVAIKDVDDLIVVHTPDATLVCRRDDEQGVKQVVEALRERGLLHLL